MQVADINGLITIAHSAGRAHISYGTLFIKLRH